MSQFQEILGRLTGVRKATKNNMNANCPCPYHDKENNHKLYLEDKGEVVAVYCQSGCTGHEIMGAIGLQLKDLYPALTEVDKMHWREIQAQKRAEEHEYALGFNLWLELSVLKQALEGRLWGEDKHPGNKTECWDREKQAMRLLPKYFKEYYK